MADDLSNRLLLNQYEAARYLTDRLGGWWSKHKLKDMRLEGKLAGYRLGNRIVYKREDLDRIVASAVPLGGK